MAEQVRHTTEEIYLLSNTEISEIITSYLSQKLGVDFKDSGKGQLFSNPVRSQTAYFHYTEEHLTIHDEKKIKLLEEELETSNQSIVGGFSWGRLKDKD